MLKILCIQLLLKAKDYYLLSLCLGLVVDFTILFGLKYMNYFLHEENYSLMLLGFGLGQHKKSQLPLAIPTQLKLSTILQP